MDTQKNAGDEVLQKVADIFKSECRADEIVARIGGDEFVLLLPKTNIKYANNIIDRIHEAIANERIDNVILSISMGFAVKQDKIRIAGLMHDIGKIGIADNILNKVEKLDHDEWQAILKHPEIGFKIKT